MLCIIAKMDGSAKAKLVQLQNAAARFGCTAKPLYGHITLVAYADGNEAELIAACKTALRNQKQRFPFVMIKLPFFLQLP